MDLCWLLFNMLSRLVIKVCLVKSVYENNREVLAEIYTALDKAEELIKVIFPGLCKLCGAISI